ncbi:MAG: DUF3159 domain-containing protein [Bifidobacterium crudilactis]|nr:DUF3159 domain-containing protein [Bifidobacterium crudilactis]MCI1637113.1 DUF3159 domain-containing protein [Bifidobacterium crudilactis]
MASDIPEDGAEPSDSSHAADGQPKRLHGLATLAQENFSVMEAIGGVRGVVESLLPGLVFVIGFVTTRNLGLTVAVSATLAVLALLVRLLQRQAIMGALSGVAAVAICLVWAWFSKDARNYYLPGFLTNAFWIAALLISAVVRVPGIGALVEFVRNPTLSDMSSWLRSWREDKPLYHAYLKVTLLWVAVFALRLLIQLPLYFSDQIGYLGTARLVMGVPFFALAIWLSWLCIAAPLHAHRRDEDGAEILKTDNNNRRAGDAPVDE